MSFEGSSFCLWYLHLLVFTCVHVCYILILNSELSMAKDTLFFHCSSSSFGEHVSSAAPIERLLHIKSLSCHGKPPRWTVRCLTTRGSSQIFVTRSFMPLGGHQRWCILKRTIFLFLLHKDSHLFSLSLSVSLVYCHGISETKPSVHLRYWCGCHLTSCNTLGCFAVVYVAHGSKTGCVSVYLSLTY